MRATSRLAALGRCSASIVLLTGLAPLQKDPVQAAVSALIERTNELHSFHVLYDTESTKDGETQTGTVELMYDGPDVGRFRISAGKGTVDHWLVGRSFYLRMNDEDWLTATAAPPSLATRTLNELFPLERPLGPGIVFAIDLKDEPDGSTDFKLTLSNSDDGRTSLLAWLSRLRGLGGELELDAEGDLIWSQESFQMRISGEHGFPETIEALNEGNEVTLRLRECRRDEPLEDALVRLPASALEAEVDPELAASLAGLDTFVLQRHNGIRRVENLLDRSRLRWTERTREDWSSFLVALHRDTIEERSAVGRRSGGEGIERFAQALRSRWEGQESDERLAALEREIAKARARLEAKAHDAIGDYLDSLPEVPLTGATAEIHDDLLEAEHEAVHELLMEHLVTPLLSDFDSAVEDVLLR